MFSKILIAMFIISVPETAISQPRTLHKKEEVKTVKIEERIDVCKVNPLVWEIPLGKSEITISYLNKRGKILFERDFSISGGNKIRLNARSDNGTSKD